MIFLQHGHLALLNAPQEKNSSMCFFPASLSKLTCRVHFTVIVFRDKGILSVTDTEYTIKITI